jgi:hypothetical protein
MGGGGMLFWGEIYQIPPDFVVNSQHIDIADVILWLALPPHFVYPRKIEESAASYPLKAAVHH